jgi:hypothetical protein
MGSMAPTIGHESWTDQRDDGLRHIYNMATVGQYHSIPQYALIPQYTSSKLHPAAFVPPDAMYGIFPTPQNYAYSMQTWHAGYDAYGPGNSSFDMYQNKQAPLYCYPNNWQSYSVNSQSMYPPNLPKHSMIRRNHRMPEVFANKPHRRETPSRQLLGTAGKLYIYLSIIVRAKSK